MASFKELPRCPYCGAEMFLCPKWAGYLEFLCPKCKSSSPKCETVSEVWDAAMHRVKTRELRGGNKRNRERRSRMGG